MKKISTVCLLLLVTTSLFGFGFKNHKWWIDREDLNIKRVVKYKEIVFYKGEKLLDEKVALYNQDFLLDKSSGFKIMYFKKGIKTHEVEYYEKYNNKYPIKYVITFNNKGRYDGKFTHFSKDGIVVYEKLYKNGILQNPEGSD